MNADSVLQILGIFAAILGVVGAAAFVYAYYLVSLNKAQLESLRGDRDDLISRVSILEADREILKAGAVEKDKKLAEAQAKITVLEGIVTHDVTINELIRSVQTHDQNVEKHYNAYMEVINDVLGTVRQLLQASRDNNGRTAT